MPDSRKGKDVDRIAELMADSETPQKAKNVIQSAMAQFMADFIAEGISKRTSGDSKASDTESLRMRYDDGSWSAVERALGSNGFTVMFEDGHPKARKTEDEAVGRTGPGEGAGTPDATQNPPTGFSDAQLKKLGDIVHDAVSDAIEPIIGRLDKLEVSAYKTSRRLSNHINWT